MSDQDNDEQDDEERGGGKPRKAGKRQTIHTTRAGW